MFETTEPIATDSVSTFHRGSKTPKNHSVVIKKKMWFVSDENSRSHNHNFGGIPERWLSTGPLSNIYKPILIVV